MTGGGHLEYIFYSMWYLLIIIDKYDYFFIDILFFYLVALGYTQGSPFICHLKTNFFYLIVGIIDILFAALNVSLHCIENKQFCCDV